MHQREEPVINTSEAPKDLRVTGIRGRAAFGCGVSEDVIQMMEVQNAYLGTLERGGASHHRACPPRAYLLP